MKTRSGSVACSVHLREVAASVAPPPPRPGRCTFFVRSILRSSGSLAALALLALAAGPACSEPRTAEAVALTEADGGDLTCDERARAQDLCTTAMRQRCESQLNDCDARCDVNGDLPANTQKAPSTRSDMESTQCRANCRQVRDGCVRAAAQHCPAPCP
jgi:hypothetical protein